ncbi:MAG: FIST C-terminal domain-containing protein [Deltaproteobacteria bacterium]|nr:FIST C-terminal domain-containing protein [Deltaproteobacteria bacterium]
MKIEQRVWTRAKGWSIQNRPDIQGKVQLVIMFAATEILKEKTFLQEAKKMYPGAHLFGCSTAGEICDTRVFDDTIVATAIQFEKTEIAGAQIALSGSSSSFEAGKMLAQPIKKEGLRHVVVLSDGLSVNGSALVKGLTSALPAGVTSTGGLAGNGDHFEETYVFWDDLPSRNTLAILGLYGDSLKIGYGSMGGWDPFGPERVITKSKENLLYELDGQSALDIYKKYLGEHANGLPATGLLFPLSIRTKNGETGIVRTILAVNEEEKSMTFAGDIPEGAYARFMKANFERLIDGSSGAAVRCQEMTGADAPDLAILISCVGRKLVLKQRVEEEVESDRDVLGGKTILTGFYSYGEISPFVQGAPCALHNQTMTITTLTEI